MKIIIPRGKQFETGGKPYINTFADQAADVLADLGTHYRVKLADGELAIVAKSVACKF